MRSLHHFTTKAKNALCWPFVDRSRLLLTFVVTTIVLGSCIWFFTSKDKQGDSARLTADAWYYHAYLPSLVFDQDLDFTDEYKITKNWYRLGKTPTGRTSNVFGIGPAIYQLPFFVIGHAKATIVGEKANGFSKSEVKLSLFASLLFSLGALFFGARLIARRLGGRYGPLAVALLTAAGGPVIYYAIRQPGYAHPFATFWAAWLIDYWDKSYRLEDTSPRSQRFWICMGLLIGAASLARPQLVLWSILGGYAAASDLARARALGFERVAMLRLVRHWLVGASCALGRERMVRYPHVFEERPLSLGTSVRAWLSRSSRWHKASHKTVLSTSLRPFLASLRQWRRLGLVGWRLIWRATIRFLLHRLCLRSRYCSYWPMAGSPKEACAFAPAQGGWLVPSRAKHAVSTGQYGLCIEAKC